jgi:hypothetical protein
MRDHHDNLVWHRVGIDETATDHRRVCELDIEACMRGSVLDAPWTDRLLVDLLRAVSRSRIDETAAWPQTMQAVDDSITAPVASGSGW